ncbi:MAG: D-cysteine desulfhydrase [Actinomycetota bacterium]|jgi:D-cysteine desulfhydrase family pyridoxal phosphate-dependent enzyme|nr:D-cysteine desulfhydrase [Actinomycetota bacterium]
MASQSAGSVAAVLDRRLSLSSSRPTPLEPADRLGHALGLAPGRLLVKRDDLTGLGGGGNKVRKLEYLCADAIDQGCDVLVTGGGRQSNHCRITAAAANKLGLDCTIVLTSPEPSVPTGNVLLDLVLQPTIVWAGERDYYGAEAAIEAACDDLRAQGRKPYAMPVGGASTIGALGYVAAGLEILEQTDDLALVVTADGSGGTHAGLVAGIGDHAKVLGVDVGTRPDLDERVPEKAAEAAALAGMATPTGTVRVDHGHFGAGYGAPTDGCREALDLAARGEGLLLDPVYTGKAMAALVTAARNRELPDEGEIVFLHTGGTPALFAHAYAAWIKG